MHVSKSKTLLRTDFVSCFSVIVIVIVTVIVTVIRTEFVSYFSVTVIVIVTVIVLYAMFIL